MAAGWGRELDALMASVRPRFGRAEPRRHAETYVRGLLSDLARKNAWTFATLAGARDPTSMQRMLNAARWDTDGVRDDVRRWVVHRFGDWNRGTLVVDEVRFPKIGSSSVGVHRLFAPGSLRAVDAQVAVFLIPAVALLSWLIDPLSLSFRPVEIAALAVEHGLVLASHDHGFRRFSRLRVVDPLTAAAA